MEDEKRAQTAAAGQADNPASDANAEAGNVSQQQAAEAEQDEKAKLAAEIETMRAENRELNDKVLRLMAEMENLRRRTDRDKAEFSKYAISEFARELLSVADNMRRAIDAVPEDAAATDPALRSLVEGIEVTERELLKVFEKYHVKRFDPQGEPFNPHLHDAMTKMDVPNVAADTIVQVVHAGYMIGDRVLRPAAVIVAKGGTDSPGNGGSGNENRIPPGAMKVPEEVQAVEEQAEAAASAGRNEARAASGRDFQVERRRQMGGGPAAGPVDDRVSQMRRQRAQGAGEPPRAPSSGGKPSTLHKPVINSGND